LGAISIVIVWLLAGSEPVVTSWPSEEGWTSIVAIFGYGV